jgi:hypothetical protein
MIGEEYGGLRASRDVDWDNASSLRCCSAWLCMKLVWFRISVEALVVSWLNIALMSASGISRLRDVGGFFHPQGQYHHSRGLSERIQV